MIIFIFFLETCCLVSLLLARMLLRFLKLVFGKWCLVMLLAHFRFRCITENLAYLLSVLMWQIVYIVGFSKVNFCSTWWKTCNLEIFVYETIRWRWEWMIGQYYNLCMVFIMIWEYRIWQCRPIRSEVHLVYFFILWLGSLSKF